MAVIPATDDFNRANENLAKVGGLWVTNNANRPVITSNQVTTANQAVAIRTVRNAGLQRSRATLVTLATATTNKGGVVVGAAGAGTAPETAFAWMTGPPFYFVRARTNEWLLLKKADLASTTTTLGTYSTAPVAGDWCELVFDPATGDLEVYVNSMTTPVITANDPVPLGANHQGIGIYLEPGTILDDFAGSWGVPDLPTGNEEVNDDFNRANQWIGASSAWQSTSGTNPQILSNVLGSTAAGLAVHTTKYSGKQTVQVDIGSVAGAGTNKSYVVAGIEDTTPAFGIEPWYRVMARTSDYILQVKNNGEAQHVTAVATGNPYNVAPQTGDTMGITYDPDTGVVEMVINDTVRATYTAAPLASDHTRVGVGLEVGNTVDNFYASWETTDVPVTWSAYELQGDLTTEIPLNVTYWTGTAETAIDMSLTTEHGGGGTVLTPVPQIHSDLIIEGWGVNTAFERDRGLYGASGSARQDYVIGTLAALGVRYVRDRIFQEDVPTASGGANTNLVHWNKLYAAGIKASVNVGRTNDPVMSTDDLNRVFGYIANNPEKIANVQGWNEPNDIVGTDWDEKTVAHQILIYNRFRAEGLHNYQHSGAYGEKMYVQSMALKDDDSAPHDIQPAYAELTALNAADYCDVGNWHRYPLQSVYPTFGTTGPTYPENNAEREALASACYGGKPLDWTEYGFHSVDSGYTATWVPHDVAAAYHIRMIVEARLRGTHRLFEYDYLSPTSSQQDFWGLIEPIPINSTDPANDWFVKPQWYTIRDFFNLVRDVGASAYNPPDIGMELEYTDSGVDGINNGGLRWGVFGKRDGTSILIMWRLMRLYNRATQSRMTPALMNVTVKTDGSQSGVVVPVGGWPIAVNINAAKQITGSQNLTPTW